MRYYSVQRPVVPGKFPKPNGNNVECVCNYDSKTYCEELGREIWGYIDYEQPLTQEQATSYELIPGGRLWFPVTVSSRKHGGGTRVNTGKPIRAEYRPADTKGDTNKMQFKTRYFSSWQEAQRIMNVIQDLDIMTKRVRMSTTQGEVKIYINGTYILSFGDSIVSLGYGVSPEDYYGDDIGGWCSSEPDSVFVLGLIWHPLDHVYHYSDIICKALGITQDEWIEGCYWNRDGRVYKATEN